MSAPSKLSERRLAFVSEALMLRALHAYRAARDEAERCGVDLSADPAVPLSFDAMRERYDNLLDEWACENPGNDADMIAYLDLVAAIVDGEREAQRAIEPCSIVSIERDFSYALTMLTSVRRWLNNKEAREYMDAAVNARMEAAREARS